MYAIWGVLYLIFFIFGYLPISLTFSISCLFGKEVCFLLKPNDICPTKDFVSSVIEYLYQIFSGGRRFLYRNRSDVKKCYCMSPIKLMFNPLTKFTPLNEIMGASSAMNGGVVLGMLILGIIYYMNGSKSQSTNK
jgi:hypothetical protein